MAMKRNISIVLNILSLIILIEATSFFNNLLLFIIAGAVPGTNLSISPILMLTFIIIMGFFLARKTAKLFEIKEEVTERAMPRKRYARL